MRIFHKNMIKALPTKTLFHQWKELKEIVKNIYDNGTPGHLLVNHVMKYPASHLKLYSQIVLDELKKREWKITNKSIEDFNQQLTVSQDKFIGSINKPVDESDLFLGWHDDKYLTICYYNLDEKHDCGGIKEEDWAFFFKQYLNVIKNMLKERGIT